MCVGFPTLEHATYSCPCQKHGSQCCHAVRETSPRKGEKGWEGRRRYHINIGLPTQTDTWLSGWTALCCHRVSETYRWKQEMLIGRNNVLSLDSVWKEDGQRFDRFYVTICTNAMQLQLQFIIYFFPASSGFHYHTHVFRSLFRVFYALRTVHITPVTSHRHVP
jgi:hypothetical protein